MGEGATLYSAGMDVNSIWPEVLDGWGVSQSFREAWMKVFPAVAMAFRLWVDTLRWFGCNAPQV